MNAIRFSDIATHSLIKKHARVYVSVKHSFFQLITQKTLLVTQFLKPETQTPEPHTKSGNHTLILGLRLSFQFHKTLFAKHKTQFSM